MKKRHYLWTSILLFMVVGCASNTNANNDVKVSEIKLEKTTINLVEGETFTLKADVLPTNATNKNITWSSENIGIASVDNKGLVTAVLEGETTITVISESNPEVFAECKVNVDKKEIENDDSSIVLSSRKMEVFLYSVTNKTQMNTYFRTDILKQYPYVSLKDYYKLFLNRDLIIETTEENVYKVTSGNNGVAIIDTKQDVLDSDDYQNFITSTIYRQDNVPNVYFDGAPFIRIKNVEQDKEATHKTINFKKYNINLIGKENDIYLPLATASNMFMGPTMLTCFYNKNSIYFIDPNDPTFETSVTHSSSDYQDGVFAFFENGKRTQDEAKFAYGELCFLIDTYYGLPGREYLHNELADSRDLDNILSNKNDMTRKAKEFLLSVDEVKYYAGMEMLDSFLSDAGHTVANAGIVRALRRQDKSDLSDEVNSCLSEIGYVRGNYAAKRNASSSYLYGLITAYSSAELQDCNYIVSGGTIMYTFDAFDFDIHTWNDYYKSPSLDKLPNDVIGNFKKMLEEYKNNSSIKNVVLNITANGGGYADLVTAFMGLMTGKTYQHFHDMIDNNYKTVNYEFDANFDGKFDENDANVKYNFNFAILTSAYSFSCGNLLPAQAKESGVMIIGDKSGGGSCAVIDATSVEGFYIRLSCPNHLAFLDGTEAEYGVPADYNLVEYLGNDEYDFSNLYNLEIMSREINNFYSKS